MSDELRAAEAQEKVDVTSPSHPSRVWQVLRRIHYSKADPRAVSVFFHQHQMAMSRLASDKTFADNASFRFFSSVVADSGFQGDLVILQYQLEGLRVACSKPHGME